MNCPKCGAENPNDSCWCGKCGNKLPDDCSATIPSEQQAPMPVAYQPIKKTKKRVRGIVRLAIAVVLIVVTFITFINSSIDPYSFKELLQLQWLPYILLFIAGLGFVVWNAVGFFADLRLSKQRPVWKVLSLISLPLSAVIFIGISMIAVYTNHCYVTQSPKGQLIDRKSVV